MRKEEFGVGSIVHVYNRGNRKQPIVIDDLDRWRFLQALFYFNNEISADNPFRALEKLLKSNFNSKLVWPKEWSPRDPLVHILAFKLMDNHYHLILQEIKPGGIAKFMRKFGTGVTNRFNKRHKQTGKLFQGSYKARTVLDDNALAYLSVYVQVKNVFEKLYGDLNKAMKDFDCAYELACQYSFGSLSAYCENHKDKNLSLILNQELLQKIFINKEEYKKLAKTCLETMEIAEDLRNACIDQ